MEAVEEFHEILPIKQSALQRRSIRGTTWQRATYSKYHKQSNYSLNLNIVKVVATVKSVWWYTIQATTDKKIQVNILPI